MASLYVSRYSQNPEGVSPYVFAPHHDEPELTVEQAMERWA